MATKTDDEILRYLENHKIMQLFENLTSCLFYDKPENPKDYLIQRLKSLIAIRDKCIGEEMEETVKLPNVGLFTHENVIGMFEMLDSQHCGYINLEKYLHGMVSLGLKNFNRCPLGNETDEINLESFTTEADIALGNMYAAFQTPKPESLASTIHDKLLELDGEYQEMDEFEDESESDTEKMLDVN